MDIKVGGKKYDLVAIVSVGTVAVLLLSYYHTYMFYSLFGVSITPFLDTTEIIFSFSGFFIGIVTFGATFLMYSTSLDFIDTKFPNLRERHQWWYLLIQSIIMSIVFGLIPLLSDSFYVRTGHIVWVFLLAILLATTQIPTFMRFFAVATAFIVIGALDSHRYYTSVVGGTPEYFVELKTDKYFLKSDSSFVYISTTNNYVFFWNDKTKKAVGYSTESLEWFSMKRNKNFSP